MDLENFSSAMEYRFQIHSENLVRNEFQFAIELNLVGWKIRL